MFWTALITIGIIFRILFLVFICFSCGVLDKITSQTNNKSKNYNINSSPQNNRIY